MNAEIFGLLDTDQTLTRRKRNRVGSRGDYYPLRRRMFVSSDERSGKKVQIGRFAKELRLPADIVWET